MAEKNQDGSVSLKSGKTVLVRELSALDEVLAYQLIGKNLDETNPIGTGMLQRYTMVALSVSQVNGEDITPPQTVNDVYVFLSQFTAREWTEVSDLYDEVNDDIVGTDAGE